MRWTLENASTDWRKHNKRKFKKNICKENKEKRSCIKCEFSWINCEGDCYCKVKMNENCCFVNLKAKRCKYFTYDKEWEEGYNMRIGDKIKNHKTGETGILIKVEDIFPDIEYTISMDDGQIKVVNNLFDYVKITGYPTK